MTRPILTTFSLLMFILPIAGTIALRNVLIGALILMLIWYFLKENLASHFHKLDRDLLTIFAFFLVFLIYAFFHSVYLSEVPNWSLTEFRRTLFYAFVYFIVGMLLGDLAYRSQLISIRGMVTVVFFSMFVHILYIDLVALDRLWSSGVITRRYGGLIQHVTAANYVTNMLLAMTMAEIVYRLRAKKRVLLVSDGVLYLLFAFCIVSTFIESLRLGDISLVLLGIGSAFIFLYQNKEFPKLKRRIIAASFALLLSVPLAYNITMDPRWSKLIETVPLALNSADSPHWLDQTVPMPKTESGHHVGGSNYERIFRAKKSLDFIASDPVGIGYGKGAFGRAFEKIYPEYGTKVYHGRDSHSAILSLAIGLGIPGIVLWFAFVYSVVKVAVKKLKESYNYFAVMTLFIVMGMFSRSFVDTNMRDHIILQYMIILGVCLFLMIREKPSAQTK